MNARDVRVGAHAIMEGSGAEVEIIEDLGVIGRAGHRVVRVRWQSDPDFEHDALIDDLTLVEEKTPPAPPVNRRRRRVRA